MSAHWTLHNALVRSDSRTRDRLVEHLLKWSGFGPIVSRANRPLKTPDLLRMASFAQFAVGSHGANHLAMALQSVEVQRSELAESKATLERLFHRPTTLFAYPYGNVDDAVASAAKDAGFYAAVTSQPVAMRSGGNLHQIPRLDIKAWEVVEFGGATPRTRSSGLSVAPRFKSAGREPISAWLCKSICY